MGNKGYQGATRGDRVLHGATGCHSGLQRVTGDYKVLQITCFLSRTFPDTFLGLFCITRLQRVTGGYKGLQGVRASYETLQGTTEDYRKRVLYLERPQILFLGLFFIKGLQGVPRGYGGFQGVTRDYKG